MPTFEYNFPAIRGIQAGREYYVSMCPLRLIPRIFLFTDLTELERSTISNRSLKLFTLSGIYNATRSLLMDVVLDTPEKRVDLAADYWCEVAKYMPDWQLAKERKVSTVDLRRDYIHAHTLALAGLGRAGNTLLLAAPDGWKPQLRKLRSLDWSRNNARQWEGRAMSAGRLSKKTVNVVLTGNLIKKFWGCGCRRKKSSWRRNFDGGGAEGEGDEGSGMRDKKSVVQAETTPASLPGR